MRLLSLVLTLVIISGLLVYYKDAILSTNADPDQTVTQQSKQIIDSAKESGEELRKALEAQQKQMDNLQNNNR